MGAACARIFARLEDAMTYSGSCFCGAVEVRADAEPLGMGFCHCRSCRSWSGGPVNAFTLRPPAAGTVTKGADQVTSFQKTEVSDRTYCAKCGGHLMTRHPTLGVVDIFSVFLPDLV